MFTGLIEEIGVVKSMDRPSAAGCVRISVLAKAVLEDLQVGASLTVNGVCLTAVAVGEGMLQVEVSGQTLAVSNLGGLKAGDGVNLERAMRLNDRLGGHLVTGHVDGVGRIRDRKLDGDSIFLSIEAPEPVLRYCVRKGSVAVDGVSLTIVDLSDKEFSVCVIPHTAKITTLGLKTVGNAVNLEGDLLGKYVERLMRREPAAPAEGRIDLDFLKRNDLI